MTLREFGTTSAQKLRKFKKIILIDKKRKQYLGTYIPEKFGGHVSAPIEKNWDTLESFFGRATGLIGDISREKMRGERREKYGA